MRKIKNKLCKNFKVKNNALNYQKFSLIIRVKKHSINYRFGKKYRSKRYLNKF